jgi:alpha-tubulin suppressor-like RCC1 family protein
MNLVRISSAALLFVQALPAFAGASVVAWGDNTAGQTNVPASATNITAVAAGGFFNLALRSNGTVLAWGTNNAAITNVPATVTNIAAISAGFAHGLALRSNGTVVAWGLNTSGQTNVPAGLTDIKAIAAGEFHNLVLRSNGTVVAWGFNSNGQTNIPVNATNVAAIATGFACYALQSNGTVRAWGSNLVGQAGVLPTLTNIIAISSGLAHAWALRNDGTAIAWGDNSFAQTNVPFIVQNIATIGSGAFNNFATLSNGFYVAWGRDDHLESSGNPQPLNGVTSISGGYFHSIALGYLNDNLTNRMPLVGSNVFYKIGNFNATEEVGEPDHYPGKTSSSSVWFTWTAPFSGGVELTATNDDFSTDSPILAVYTGTTFSNMVRQSFNSADFFAARTVFTANNGQTYLIVFDTKGSFSQGNVELRLVLTPQPANDSFANPISIPGNFYAVTGSFIGGSRETGEPSHNEPTNNQTLWWSWVAPSNAPNPLSVRLFADGVSFPPGMGVYTGSAVGSLTNIPITRITNGMTSDATFNAVPGTTYRIALAGRQNDPDSTSVLIGNYRFRMNTRGLALSITNLVPTTNGAGAVSFTANARIQNFNTNRSSPLRVSLSSISGLSSTRPLDEMPDSTITNIGIFNSSPLTLTNGQVVLVAISGTAPAPDPSDQSTPIAYGIYAELQEQPVTNKWFTVDETLVTFDQWPGIGQVVGPGGGVIRLDPNSQGLSAFNPLQTVIVLGPTSLNEGRSTNYTARATYTDATVVNFTNTTWSASAYSITTNGLFTAGIATSNTTVTLTAPYLYGGILYNATTNIIVSNLPPPAITNFKMLTNGTLSFTINGVANRSHVIEAATNLVSPITWTPLLTNSANSNGVLNISNISTSGFPKRFLRAREQ